MNVHDKQFVSRINCFLLDIGEDVIKVAVENKGNLENFSMLLGNLRDFEYQKLVDSMNNEVSLLVIDGRVVDIANL